MSSYRLACPKHLVTSFEVLRPSVLAAPRSQAYETAVPIKTSNGTATYHVQTDHAVALLIEAFGGPTAVQPPLTTRGRWNISRYVVVLDEAIPVLTALALIRFGPWNDSQRPYWLDGDWTNESIENVGLANVKASVKAPSQYGPSGTREYSRSYYARNKAKISGYQKSYRGRLNAARQAIQSSIPSSDPRKPRLTVEVNSQAVESLIKDPTFNPDDVFADILGPTKPTES